MAQPSEKNPKIDKAITDIFGIDRKGSIVKNRCAMCGREVSEFRNRLSQIEYSISGMCQACQDKICGTEKK